MTGSLPVFLPCPFILYARTHYSTRITAGDFLNRPDRHFSVPFKRLFASASMFRVRESSCSSSRKPRGSKKQRIRTEPTLGYTSYRSSSSCPNRDVLFMLTYTFTFFLQHSAWHATSFSLVICRDEPRSYKMTRLACLLWHVSTESIWNVSPQSLVRSAQPTHNLSSISVDRVPANRQPPVTLQNLHVLFHLLAI